MTYIEQARVRFLIDILAVDVIQSLPIILASLKVDFRPDPVRARDRDRDPGRLDRPDELLGVARDARRIEDESAARVVAEASTVLVAYDYATERPIAVPDAWRTAFTAHEGHSLEATGLSDEQTFDLLILGGGMSYVGAIRAAQLGMKVAVVERDKLGGTCLNRGCIPSKALLETADLLHRVRSSEASLGSRTPRASVSTRSVSANAETPSSTSTCAALSS